MKALSKGTEVQVKIIKLFSTRNGSVDVNSKPKYQIATVEGSDRIDWNFLMFKGFAPVVFDSPTILPCNAKDYLFTDDLWDCDCKHGNWLHYRSPECPICKQTPTGAIFGVSHITFIKVALMGFKPVSILDAFNNMCDLSAKGFVSKDVAETMAKHLMYYDFDWVKAFDVSNYK